MVANDGAPILPEDRPHIFERFYKADKAHTVGKGSGTGLGLSICQRIIQQHGQTIRLMPTEVGASFEFTLEAGIRPMSLLGSVAVADEKTKVVVWTNARHDYDYMSQKIDAFNTTNTSNIEIVYEVYTDNYKQVAELGFDTGNGPDVFNTGAGVWDLALAGQALPLNDFLTDADLAYFGGNKGIVESVNMFNGKILSLPMSISTPRLVYNKGIFEKAGIEKVQIGRASCRERV